ncbi:FAD/NAD(P)-binding domain-containing protein [Massarina eburnea CBS 473.64]|uniref:FAD/NAD(P)-binding domain-containing protein n=1 Tax=Massarina eburnea CBS 473.64 TaxID=1395130 RepID=A0A6A6RWV7_9PLEO|nr:FAD/NAD(P)-binding domain-containing protein [Massarina eburnea CBS 473.64]
MASIPVPKAELNGTAEGSSYDAIIIGAGFSGISNLHRLRSDGLNCHVFEAGEDFGGVWYWNRYPGARVDSETPFYQLSIPEVYQTWSFSQRFPDHHELRAYMAHVDKTLNLRKDVSFNSKVNSCTWDKNKSRWAITTENGKKATGTFLILCSGLLHRTHLPEWKGLKDYKGVIHHSGAWPEGTNVKGKKVAVIGSGATSVQIVQELGKEADQLTLLMRRPSYCLAMAQRAWSKEEQDQLRAYYPAIFAAARTSAVGFPVERKDKRIQDEDPSVRERHFEDCWRAGGFQFLLGNYSNVVLDPEANKVVYDFWKKKVRERLTDPEKQKLMAPDDAPYYFGTKRSPLESDYYTVLDQPNVDIVDLNKNPIDTFTEKGLKVAGEDDGGGEREFDVVVCATGFDSFTGSLTHMGLKNKDGIDIKDVWSDGVRTYLGMMMHGFPNAFMVYSPQAPTALSNGPTILECQTGLVGDTIKSLRAQGVKTIEATPEAEDEWKKGMNAMVEHTLYPFTNSWWNTSNIPGKKAENQSYIGGINNYEAQCRDKMTGWKGFEVISAA